MLQKLACSIPLLYIQPYLSLALFLLKTISSLFPTLTFNFCFVHNSLYIFPNLATSTSVHWLLVSTGNTNNSHHINNHFLREIILVGSCQFHSGTRLVINACGMYCTALTFCKTGNYNFSHQCQLYITAFAIMKVIQNINIELLMNFNNYLVYTFNKTHQVSKKLISYWGRKLSLKKVLNLYYSFSSSVLS